MSGNDGVVSGRMVSMVSGGGLMQWMDDTLGQGPPEKPPHSGPPPPPTVKGRTVGGVRNSM
jgi:hypothetical protein